MKYKKGRAYNSTLHAVENILSGQAVYFNHKFMASGFIVNWSLKQIQISVNNRRLYPAIKQKGE